MGQGRKPVPPPGRTLEVMPNVPLQESEAAAQTAYFAAGCFWSVEDGFQRVPGVIDAFSGYQGGSTVDPTYEDVCGGETGHAETVRVVFDPARVSYLELLAYFFKAHSPLRDRSGRKDQYRAAIFTTDDTQREQVEAFLAARRYGGQATTPTFEISPAKTFYPAEERHQNYRVKHPR
jgi:methionine-S-sulfoxide reductase